MKIPAGEDDDNTEEKERVETLGEQNIWPSNARATRSVT